MTRQEVAKVLDLIARYKKLRGENKFKVGAYERAAEALAGADGDLEDLVRSGKLTSIEGIGKGTGSVIEEIVREGRSRLLEELQAEIPEGVLDLAELRGVGAKKARELWQRYGISSIDELETAIAAGTAEDLPGFGTKTVGRVEQSIRLRREDGSKVLLPMALETAASLSERLVSIAGVQEAIVSGQVRRRHETPDSIDIVVIGSPVKSVASRIIEADLPVEIVGRKGALIEGRARPDLQVRLHLATPSARGHALLTSTGPEDLVAGIAKLARERGVDLTKVRASGEEEVFERIGLPWIPPERRDAGVDAAADLPLVDRGDIRGTFHVHSTWSDGKDSLEAMVGAARDAGLEYVGISDHSKTAAYAGGLDETRVKMQAAELRRIRKAFPDIRVFHGTECDILPDGSLDFDDDTLEGFDFVIGSVHSQFSMNRAEMTDRILRAMDNPFLTILGHVSGRKLLIRPGYEVEYERIFDKAVERGVIIEINGHPRRLDLDWQLMARAMELGVRFSINPDAHSVGAIDHVETGVWNARRGGVPPDRVFNTLGVDEVARHLGERRKQAMKKSK